MDLNLPSYVENDPLTGSAVLSRRDIARFYLSYSGLDITPENIEQVWRSAFLFVCCVCVCVGVVSVVDEVCMVLYSVCMGCWKDDSGSKRVMQFLSVCVCVCST